MGILTVSGLPGSGTSTVSALLAQRSGWEYINAGAIFRQLAAESGLSLEEYGHRAEATADIDRELDARMVELALAAQPGGVILEGRLTGWMAHEHSLDAFKVWLAADRQARLQRVGQRDGQTLAEASEALDRRERSELVRYAAHHGIDIADLSIYDLTIDSGSLTPEDLADRIAVGLDGQSIIPVKQT